MEEERVGLRLFKRSVAVEDKAGEQVIHGQPSCRIIISLFQANYSIFKTLARSSLDQAPAVNVDH